MNGLCHFFYILELKLGNIYFTTVQLNWFAFLVLLDLYASSSIFFLTEIFLKLLTLPDHLSSPPVFSGVHVTLSLVLYICLVDRCLTLCTFSFGHCVVLRYTDSYDKWNISVVICDTDIPYRSTKSWWRQ
jgi:hypothetical protein